VASWSCGCKWGAYHWGAADDFSRFAGRMCSHALALQYEAQSRGMFGKSVHTDDTKPSWVPRKVVVKYDIDDRRDVTGPATPVHASLTVAGALLAHLRGSDLDGLSLAFTAAGIDMGAALRASASVNSPFGEPVPSPAQYTPGPTKPADPTENPASAGWASAPEPDGWGVESPAGMSRMVASLDDDAIFEPEMGKEAFLPLLIPLAEGLMGAGAGAAAAGAGEAAAGGGLVRTMAPKVLEKAVQHKVLDKVMNPGGPGGPAGPGGPQSSPAPVGEHPVDDNLNNPLNYGARADLHEQPEGALPSTDGSDDDIFGAAGDPTDPSGLEPTSPGFVSTGSVEDIVAQFQATAGAQHLQSGSSGGAGGNDGLDIAAAAKHFLETGQKPAEGGLSTTALKDYTLAEREQIINEGEGVKAANLDRLDIAGTHYEHLEAALAAADNDEEWMS
jgi:hypothetical protein